MGRLEAKQVANMAPTWLPKRSPNRSKIEAKIDQFFNASWDPIFERCWWILGPKWKQVGLPNRTQNDLIFKRRFLKKPGFSLGKTMILKVRGMEVGSKNRSKMHVNVRRHLGFDFSSILLNFEDQVGTIFCLQNSLRLEPC